MPVAEIRGVNIVYRIVGEHGPWLTLTQGGRRGHEEFISLAEKIAARGFRVLLHDRRNTGGSDIAIDDPLSDAASEEEIWADDLHELLIKLEAEPAFIGGSSSGARMSMLFALRHREATRGLLLLRVTGGDFAAGRLPEQYYGQFVETARSGGMAAICETEDYAQRIAANPKNRARLMAMDPGRYIAIMSRWLSLFERGASEEVMGMPPARLAELTLPVLIIPGNDKIHSLSSALAAHRMIEGSELHRLPIEDTDTDLIPFEDWAEHEEEIAEVFCQFMHRSGAHAG